MFRKPLKSARTAAAGTLLLGSALLAGTAPVVRAADPYDKSLEQRVEALERELNTMSNDSKGKNVTTTDVPTFVQASSNVQELVFSGELRFRNEYSTTDNQAANNTTQADANRFRFRLFADYKLNNNFFAGAAVQTTLASDSGNTTISEGFDNYALYLWRFFIGWHTKDDSIRIVAGKQPNPFYEETELLWDADISPIGLTEQVKYSITPQLDVSLIGGQFLFEDNPENAFYDGNGTANPPTTAVPGQNVPGGDYNQDAYLFYQQLLATFKVNNNISVSAAPGFLFYGEHGGTAPYLAVSPSSGNAGAGRGAGNGTGQFPGVTTGIAQTVNSTVTVPAGGGRVTVPVAFTPSTLTNTGALQNSAAFNSANATRNLGILTFDGDVKLGLGKIKVKAYGQAAYNIDGGARIAQEYANATVTGGATARGLDGFQDKIAFSTGFTIGSDYQIKKSGDYVFLAEYRQVGLGSVDPNLNDSDWNFSRLGFRGIKIAASYGFYSWLIGSVTYFGSNNLGSEKNLNIGVGDYNASHIFQFDLTTRF